MKCSAATLLRVALGAAVLAAPSGAAAQPSPPAAGTEAPAVPDPALQPVAPAPHTLGSFRDALGMIAAQSPDLALARQEVEKAEGLSRQALAGALPSVTATGTLFHNLLRDTSVVASPVQKPLAPAPVGLAEITLAQPLLAPRAWYEVGTANLEAKSARLSLVDRERTTLIAVAGSILAVVAAERVAEINRAGMRSALERVALTRLKMSRGAAVRLDLVRTEQDVRAARTALLAGDETLRRTREALGLALGSAEPFGVARGISLNDIEPTLRAVCSPAPLDQRADVVAARTDLAIARRGVTDGKLAFSPHADASTTLAYSNDPDDAFTYPSGRNYAWSIQGVLTIPIWDGGVRYGALRTARAAEEQQKVRLGTTERAAGVEVAQTTRAVDLAEQERELALESRDLAVETAKLSRAAFEAGTSTSFELVGSARQLREAEAQLALRELEVVKARIAAVLSTSSCRY
jgi:outer membrane protein, multidrug efflux system